MKITPSQFRWLLVAFVVAVGILRGSSIAGGADSYGYLSQAELWLKGDLLLPQPDVPYAPWPEGQWTFSPVGYRPSLSRLAIVPIYSPGFPLLLAAFTFVGGHCAARLVVPLAAGLLVAITFAIGRRAASDQIGAAAAWLVATSPVVLYMLMSPMSDLPAAACWGLAAYGCLIGSRRGAALAGAAAALAILIRPNLAHVALVAGLWLAFRDLRVPTLRARFVRSALFAGPVVLACLAVATLNQFLYGAATMSGYGNPARMFSIAYLPQNVRNYGAWLVEAQTPLGLLGLMAIWVPAFPWLRPRVQMEGRTLLGLMALAVVGGYLFYGNYDAWWYLRFLLPCWPAMCVGTARLLAAPSGRSFGRIGYVLLVGLGLYGLWFSHRERAFDIGRNEQRYVAVARLVRDTTGPNSVIIATQHSGSVRYYGERMTLRYELLSERWLDGAIAWLKDRGMRPYILLDDWEHQQFKDKFSRQNAAGRLDVAKVFEYRDGATTILYDPLQPPRGAERPLVLTADTVGNTAACVPPGTLPLVFPLR